MKLGATEHGDDRNLKLHYGAYYAKLGHDIKHEDDYSWLSAMKLDPRITESNADEYEYSLRKKWGEKHAEAIAKYVDGKA